MCARVQTITRQSGTIPLLAVVVHLWKQYFLQQTLGDYGVTTSRNRKVVRGSGGEKGADRLR